jgi:hypothetical protein
MCANGTMRPVETVLRRGEKGERGRVNLTKIYSKHFCQCYKVPPICAAGFKTETRKRTRWLSPRTGDWRRGQQLRRMGTLSSCG